MEIGLWESFLVYKDTKDLPLPSEILNIIPSTDDRSPNHASLIKDHLVSLTERDLPKRMGERYKDIVISCLTCLDEDNSDFGDPSQFQDQDGVLVGVRYIEKVILLRKL